VQKDVKKHSTRAAEATAETIKILNDLSEEDRRETIADNKATRSWVSAKTFHESFSSLHAVFKLN
jgi:hypothetical protein